MQIFILEDDEAIGIGLTYSLENEGYAVTLAKSVGQAYDIISNNDFALYILDLTLPDGSGYDVCKKIKEKGDLPVIFLTAFDDEVNVVMGFDMGADDYIVKPLEMREVIARVRAIFRRLAPEDSGKISFDKLTVDKQAYDLIVDGKRVDAPPKEIELLYFLASNPNRVFTRAQLLDDVWGFDYFGDTRTVDVHVKRLREKLEGVSDKWDLKTVWGVGYKFETRD